MTAPSGNFADLQTRILSAVVLAVLGIGAIWLGGIAFLALMVVASGLMVAELGLMLAQDQPRVRSIGLAVLAAGTMVWLVVQPGLPALAGLLIAPVLGGGLLARDRWIYFSYTLAINFAVATLIGIRVWAGFDVTLWLILVVIASDIGGYFFGRIIGGPKIFPRISPKKTWSGTIGGWALAALVGAGFLWALGWPVTLVWISILAAVAAQAGDMAESAIKRHTGVKDSSGLIPGHGGLLDRFDGLIGAALLVLIVGVLLGQPSGVM